MRPLLFWLHCTRLFCNYNVQFTRLLGSWFCPFLATKRTRCWGVTSGFNWGNVKIIKLRFNSQFLGHARGGWRTTAFLRLCFLPAGQCVFIFINTRIYIFQLRAKMSFNFRDAHFPAFLPFFLLSPRQFLFSHTATHTHTHASAKARTQSQAEGLHLPENIINYFTTTAGGSKQITAAS